MESTRPIRALTRGLDALTALNMRDGATVSEIAQEIRLPRTTVYRILETLGNAGFVFRDVTDDKYRLTLLVRNLSGGYGDASWITRIGKPQLFELSRDIVWPLSLSSLSETLPDTGMVVRESTDHTTPLATERYAAGSRLPLLDSSAGLAYLASCPAAEREALLAKARGPSADVKRMLAEVKVQGYAAMTRIRRSTEEASVSVAVLLHERVLAVLTVRFTTAAVPLKTALERYLPRLRQCAARMSSLVLAQQAEARSHDAPEAAA